MACKHQRNHNDTSYDQMNYLPERFTHLTDNIIRRPSPPCLGKERTSSRHHGLPRAKYRGHNIKQSVSRLQKHFEESKLITTHTGALYTCFGSRLNSNTISNPNPSGFIFLTPTPWIQGNPRYTNTVTGEGRQ